MLITDSRCWFSGYSLYGFPFNFSTHLEIFKVKFFTSTFQLNIVLFQLPVKTCGDLAGSDLLSFPPVPAPHRLRHLVTEPESILPA